MMKDQMRDPDDLRDSALSYRLSSRLHKGEDLESIRLVATRLWSVRSDVELPQPECVCCRVFVFPAMEANQFEPQANLPSKNVGYMRRLSTTKTQERCKKSK